MSYHNAGSREHLELTKQMGRLHQLRQARQFKEADALRDQVLSVNTGFRVRLTPDRAVLEEWPIPLFGDDIHKGLNFGMFITASDRG